MNYYFYFIAQLIWIIFWLKFLDYFYETSCECKQLFRKLDWCSPERRIDLYEIIESFRKEGKSLREEVNAFVSGKNIQVAILDWYDKVYLLIPKIHKCHDIYVPLPLWDEILRQYAHSYDEIVSIAISIGDNIYIKDNNKNRVNRNNYNYNNDEDSYSTDDDTSTSEEEEEEKNEVALDKLDTLKQELSYDELDYDELDFFKQYHKEKKLTSKPARDVTRFVRMATFLSVYGIFRFIFDIALLVVVIIYVSNDEELFINADGWQKYRRLIASWSVTVLYPNFISIDYLFNVMPG